MKWLLFCGFILLLVVESTAGAQPVQSNPPGVTLKHRIQSFPGTFTDSSEAVGVGDIDGDGFQDFALISQSIFTPSTDPFEHGSVVIYSGADQSVIHSLSALVPVGVSTRFGVCAVGDHNGDGFDDIAVSLPTMGLSGEFRYLSGRDLTVIMSFSGPLGTENGNLLVQLDDIDGDGVKEIGFSCQSQSNPTLNKIRVVSGTTGVTILDIAGPNNDLGIGGVVGGFVPVGDVDGDGTNDILVGEPFWNGGLPASGFNWIGRARVFSGADGSVIHLAIGSLNTGGFLGAQIAGLGDINGDGFSDIAFTKSNGIFVHSGVDGSLITTMSHPNQSIASYSLTSVGDVDGDGTNDLAYDVSDLNQVYLSPTDNHQEVRIISGASFSTIARIPAPDGAADKFLKVVEIGDTNGNGRVDFIVTSIMDSPSPFMNPIPPEFPDPQVLLFQSGITPIGKITSNSGAEPALSYDWIPENSMSNSIRGTLKASGASPFASGVIVASLAPIDFPTNGIDLLVAIDPINLLRVATLGANSSGEFVVSNISRASIPQLSGTTIYSQIFETAPTLSASNALAIIVVP